MWAISFPELDINFIIENLGVFGFSIALIFILTVVYIKLKHERRFLLYSFVSIVFLVISISFFTAIYQPNNDKAEKLSKQSMDNINALENVEQSLEKGCGNSQQSMSNIKSGGSVKQDSRCVEENTNH